MTSVVLGALIYVALPVAFSPSLLATQISASFILQSTLFSFFFVFVLLLNWCSCLMLHSVASTTSSSSIIFHSLIEVIRVKQSSSFSGSYFFSLLILFKFRYPSIGKTCTLKLFNALSITSSSC